MTSHNRDGLETALAEVSQLYPDLRFGQLIKTLAVLAGEETPENPYDIDDTRLLRSAVTHLSNRLRQLGTERIAVLTALTPVRIELLQVFQELRRRYPGWRFGQLASNVASWSDVSLYDAEDEQLLASGRQHLAGNQA
jgi:hypothetical protein